MILTYLGPTHCHQEEFSNWNDLINQYSQIENSKRTPHHSLRCLLRLLFTFRGKKETTLGKGWRREKENGYFYLILITLQSWWSFYLACGLNLVLISRPDYYYFFCLCLYSNIRSLPSRPHRDGCRVFLREKKTEFQCTPIKPAILQVLSKCCGFRLNCIEPSDHYPRIFEEWK